MIRILAKRIRQYMTQTVLTPVFVILEVVLEVIIPLFTANLIDFGIDAGNMQYVFKMGIALLLSSFASLFFGVAAGRSSSISSAGFARNLRDDMFANIQTFSFSNIDKFSTASIVTRLTTDVNNVQMAFMMLTRMAFRAPVMMIFSLIVSFGIDAKLSLIFIAALPVLAVGMYLIISRVHPVFERIFKTYDKLNGIVQENVRGIRVVKSFVREDYETQKFKKISGDIYRDFSGAEKVLALNMPLMQFCMYACMLLISWFGARAIIASGNNPDIGLSTGELMSLITYAMQILMSLMMISMVFVMITISRASAERIVELLSEKSNIVNPENPIETLADGSIEFENVGFFYSAKADKACLSNINLKIASGETVGIIGATGSSKSTLVQLIPRLYDASTGIVKVGGNDIKKYDLDVLRGGVAMVLQKNELFSGTIRDNLKWGNENASDEDIAEASASACADEFVSGFPKGYDTVIEQGGTNVSGGQKQRLCIARALLKKPKILILDDSTSAVDMKTDAKIRRALHQYLPKTTKIIIAQRAASVKDADKIIVMDDGQISDVGTHDELMSRSGIYREVYESQTRESEGDDNE